MHICFLNMPIEYYSPVSGGAISTIIMQTATEMLARGHEVTVLTPTNDDPAYSIGKVVPLAAKQRDQLSLPQRVLSRLRNKTTQWDYAYYEYYLASFQSALKKLTPKPDVVICFNDLVSPKYIRQVLPNAKILVDLQNEQGTRQTDLSDTIAAVDTFVACSKHIRNWTQNKYSVPDSKLAVINNGIDLEAFYPRPDFLEPRPCLNVLFIGRIDRNKGPDIAADAVAALQREGLPVHLTVAGGLWFYGHGQEMTDPFFRSLKEKMEAIGADYKGHVTRPDVPALVRSQDVSCVLSRTHDPNPLVCLESMASGCAVIGADRGGIPDAFGEAGMLVDPEDFNAVVGYLRRMATDSDALRQQKQSSVTRASRASWAVNVDQWEALLSAPS
ncbi:MAG: glycosyltransferase family 4 protein [Janthinobacterium lividum]